MQVGGVDFDEFLVEFARLLNVSSDEFAVGDEFLFGGQFGRQVGPESQVGHCGLLDALLKFAEISLKVKELIHIDSFLFIGQLVLIEHPLLNLPQVMVVQKLNLESVVEMAGFLQVVQGLELIVELVQFDGG